MTNEEGRGHTWSGARNETGNRGLRSEADCLAQQRSTGDDAERHDWNGDGEKEEEEE